MEVFFFLNNANRLSPKFEINATQVRAKWSQTMSFIKKNRIPICYFILNYVTLYIISYCRIFFFFVEIAPQYENAPKSAANERPLHDSWRDSLTMQGTVYLFGWPGSLLVFVLLFTLWKMRFLLKKSLWLWTANESMRQIKSWFGKKISQGFLFLFLWNQVS